jgi:hypothetical protein
MSNRSPRRRDQPGRRGSPWPALPYVVIGPAAPRFHTARIGPGLSAITECMNTPCNTKGHSSPPTVRGNNSRGHGRGRRPIFHQPGCQE